MAGPGIYVFHRGPGQNFQVSLQMCEPAIQYIHLLVLTRRGPKQSVSLTRILQRRTRPSLLTQGAVEDHFLLVFERAHQFRRFVLKGGRGWLLATSQHKTVWLSPGSRLRSSVDRQSPYLHLERGYRVARRCGFQLDIRFAFENCDEDYLEPGRVFELDQQNKIEQVRADSLVDITEAWQA